jgi:hypothetical protein
MTAIAEKIREFKEKLRACEQQFKREPGSVSLLAASKSQSIEKILEAYAAGITLFGENYLQEALEKIAHLKDKNIEWHFIGPIQSNKTKKIAENFAWVHGVENARIAKRLNDQRPEHLGPLNICIEVNISDEKTKSGIAATELIDLATYCQTLSHLKLRGLMCIPEHNETFEKQRAIFKKMKFMFDDLCNRGFALDTLSMGMSQDWQAAVAEGATLIRLGTLIFGARQ